MHSSSIKTLKLFNSIQPTIQKTLIRTLLNPFASKTIETANDAHSNLLTDTENVFELQHHTVKPSSMVNYPPQSIKSLIMQCYRLKRVINKSRNRFSNFRFFFLRE